MSDSIGMDDSAAGRAFQQSTKNDVFYIVRVLDGPDCGFSLLLSEKKPQPALIGSGPLCEMRLSDAKVARRHAALDAREGELHVTDLESANGTFVGGVRIVEAFLRGGEVLRLGATALHVERHESETPGSGLPRASSFGSTSGASIAMRRLYSLCENLASSEAPVLIEGEVGTGKSVLAGSIHAASSRASGPFVTLDCTAVPGGSIDSALFGGDEEGRGTISSDGKGLIEEADGGTLLIRELAYLGPSIQAKLLQAIDSRQFRRPGTDRVVAVGARFIATTRWNLDREVDSGRFHDDLLVRGAWRLVQLPPLRIRTGDVGVLLDHFCLELGIRPDEIPKDLRSRWDASFWPGNVRELRDAVAHWAALGEVKPHPGSVSDIHVGGDCGKFDALVAKMLAESLSLADARQRLLNAFDATYIERQLREHSNHVGRSAAASGIGKRYFQMLRARHRPR